MMPDHTQDEQDKNENKKKKAGDSSIGRTLRNLLPGQLGKSLFDRTNRKIKKATKK